MFFKKDLCSNTVKFFKHLVHNWLARQIFEDWWPVRTEHPATNSSSSYGAHSAPNMGDKIVHHFFVARIHILVSNWIKRAKKSFFFLLEFFFLNPQNYFGRVSFKFHRPLVFKTIPNLRKCLDNYTAWCDRSILDFCCLGPRIVIYSL